MGWFSVNAGSRNRDSLGESAVPAQAENGEGGAFAVFASKAELAFAAGQAWIQHYFVTGIKVLDARANGGYDSGCIAAEDMGKLELTSGAAFPDPNVEMIQGRGANVDYGLVCRGGWIRKGGDFDRIQSSISTDDDSLHPSLSPFFVWRG